MSRPRPRGRRALAAVLSAGLWAALLPATTFSAAPAALATAVAHTSAAERQRVDRVRTPKLQWFTCAGDVECATVKLPMDYDQPHGRKVEVALAKLPAADPDHRIGSLFINPGGPGGSAVDLVLFADLFLGSDLLDRFDIVGVDPRGVSYSQQVRCFRDLRAQTLALTGYGLEFPFTSDEENAWMASAKKEAVGCSHYGTPLSRSMSTAEVARDMDVLRRAVGDQKLTYLGFSYGTYLGQVYANLFPDRVRAIAIDGIVDPIGWAGTSSTRSIPQTLRIKSAEGAWKSLSAGLERCRQAGAAYCPIMPDPQAAFDAVATRLKQGPLIVDDPDTGETYEVGYTDFVGFTLSLLYSPGGLEAIAAVTHDLQAAIAAEATPDLKVKVAKAVKKAIATYGKQFAPGYEFPYDNSLDAYSSVMCTDGLNPKYRSTWLRATKLADARAPYFGRIWGWQSVQCASSVWTAHDEDSYRGPFNRFTAAPVLIVGDYYDPATNYQSAQAVEDLLPNSRLLTSDSWGHTAYGTSACVTDAVDGYLVGGSLPAEGTVCHGDYVPFTEPLETPTSDTRPSTFLPIPLPDRKGLPKVAPPFTLGDPLGK